MGIERVDELIASSMPVHGWMTPEKGRRLARLVAGLLPPVRCVELGVFGGRGVAVMALAIKHCLRGAGTVDGIDPYTADAALEGTNDEGNRVWWGKLNYAEILKSALAAFDQLQVKDVIRMRIARSQDVVNDYPCGTIDLLHQDSNHSEEVSTWEVTNWAPKMIRGGLWVFDDTNWPSTRPAQELLLTKGFTRIEDHDTWAVFRAPFSLPSAEAQTA